MYPTAYLDYLIYFHVERDYFECHEVLEEYWKEHDPKNRTSIWVGLIQVAVGLYHHRRGNRNGAIRMYEKAISILEKQKTALSELGLHKSDLIRQLQSQHQLASNTRNTFHDINLTFSKEDLLPACIERCQQLGLTWTTTSTPKEDIIYKHKLRDRSDIIRERQQQLKRNQTNDE
ncbi:DUF309 domain-containing protein [Alkalihalobacillus sp. MEB130]|uniref:DUF309 domain-containing protein n=1 Tax=Alkalihalobacillus sp. MEB130 TaxID=2976704 RepID=UPI0028DF430B|nr:DUF309 domain-containing protein [Alkalihalobacillus sp. MEB130]MDT8860092.1 DUF309 domain-containing protein [Alkalihalobacillus sp. MEB130]